MSARTAAAAVIGITVLALAAAVSAASFGGGFWSAYGPGRVCVKRAGLRPVEVMANLRFDFEGAADAVSGTGTILAYDPTGQETEASLPFTWTTRNGRTSLLDLASPAFEDYLAGLLGPAAGKPAAVTLEAASARCVVPRGEDDLRAVLRARGTVLLGADPPRRLVVNIRVR